VTVDDLDKNRRDRIDTRDDMFARLAGAFHAASALQHEAGLAFVVAPIPDSTGSVLCRLTDRYTLVVHPFLTGQAAGGDTFARVADRNAVVGLLTELHRATDVAGRHAHLEDAGLPNGDALFAALDDLGQAWDTGPYGEPARAALAGHAAALGPPLQAYDSLAHRVLGDTGRMVITHGEPNASNIVVNDGGLHLIDWESARLAPPERDLWSLTQEDPSIVDRYAITAGRVVNLDAVNFYRLWYDLFEIGGYLRLFRQPHADDSDTAESWRNLQYFLEAARRWPR
jgi:hypothetical protein